MADAIPAAGAGNGVAASEEDVAAIDRLRSLYGDVRRELARVIIGQDNVIRELLICIFARGHALLMGVPGLAKTLLIHSLSDLMHLKFSRIQFTPDLMPSDITGTDILQETDTPGRRAFEFVKGPLFADAVLADEINRTPPKTQAALLEAMQENSVNVGSHSFRLDPPFFVLATQNPIEQEGTYPLPEAQVDRFMLKLVVTYPSREEERRILDAMAVTSRTFDIRPVVQPEAILRARKVVDEIYVDDKIKDYILNIVFATREPEKFKLDLKPYLRFGASPRATICLTVAARAHAFLQGRGYVTPQDVKSIAPDVLRHRVLLTYEAEAEEMTSDSVVGKILSELPVP